MENMHGQDKTSGTERGRSPSGVPEVRSGGEEPPVFDEDPSLAATDGQEEIAGLPRLTGRRRERGFRKKITQGPPSSKTTPQQRLLLLDTWQRSGLPAKDFAALVGLSKHTLYKWKQRFEEDGPEGLLDSSRKRRKDGPLSDLTRRTILMIKNMNQEYGCQRISDMLYRGPALAASANTVAKVLREAGYEIQDVPTRPHPDKVRRFERSRQNELWQTDIFTFVLKRQNRRVHLIAFMDDYSRFIVSFGLHASASTALVLEVLRAGIASYQPPKEVLTDNGTQYVTWRGKSAFTKELEKRGIKQVVASPRRPQTLGKIERFWGTMWRECIEKAVFLDLGDARRRIGLFIDYYNFQRTHQGIDGLVPADRFFGAAPEVLKTLKERVDNNSLDIARNGLPKEPFYLTGNVRGKPVSVYAEGEQVIVTGEGVERHEVELKPPEGAEAAGDGASCPVPLCPEGSVGFDEKDTSEEPQPGVSPLDEGLKKVAESFSTSYNGKEIDDDEENRSEGEQKGAAAGVVQQ